MDRWPSAVKSTLSAVASTRSSTNRFTSAAGSCLPRNCIPHVYARSTSSIGMSANGLGSRSSGHVSRLIPVIGLRIDRNWSAVTLPSTGGRHGRAICNTTAARRLCTGNPPGTSRNFRPPESFPARLRKDFIRFKSEWYKIQTGILERRSRDSSTATIPGDCLTTTLLFCRSNISTNVSISHLWCNSSTVRRNVRILLFMISRRRGSSGSSFTYLLLLFLETPPVS